jgi:hypothetical protein
MITRKAVVPHLLSAYDNRKAVVLVDSFGRIIVKDGTMEIRTERSTVIKAVEDGIVYFDTGGNPELNRATVVVELLGVRTTTFSNLLSLPYIRRQWVLVVP